MRLRIALSILVVNSVINSVAIAQQNAGSILGTVFDPSGATIAGAAVKASKFELSVAGQAFCDSAPLSRRGKLNKISSSFAGSDGWKGASAPRFPPVELIRVRASARVVTSAFRARLCQRTPNASN